MSLIPVLASQARSPNDVKLLKKRSKWLLNDVSYSNSSFAFYRERFGAAGVVAPSTRKQRVRLHCQSQMV